MKKRMNQHCAASNVKNRRRWSRRARQRSDQRKILLKSGLEVSKIMKITTFSIFTKSGLQRRTSDMENSSYREARDLRLSPSDAKYDKVPGKIMRSWNELKDSEISPNNDLKKTFMSVSKKWPTSSPCTRITLKEQHLKVKCSTSYF